MNLAEVKTLGIAFPDRKRRGRGTGSGNGKTAGKGHKGAKARSGWSRRIGWEGGQMPLYRRLPKRGFNNKIFKKVYTVVNVSDLEAFDAGADALLDLERSLESRALAGGTARARVKANLDEVAGELAAERAEIERLEAEGAK